MRLFPTLLAVALAVTATTASAQTYRAENRVTVTDRGDGLFSASINNRYGARGAWCAAADYAQRVLRAPGTNRIYVIEPISQGQNTVTFALSPRGTTPTGVTSTTAALRSPGANLSIDHAYQFCYDARLINRG